MKLALIFIFISFSAWSGVNLELVLNSTSVKQGEIVSGKLIVRESTGQTSFSGLKGKNLSKTLYLVKLSPFMGKQGVLESEAKVIFLNVPQSSFVGEQIDGQEIKIFWNQIEVIPTEVSKSFLLGDFEIPERIKVLPWLIGLLILLVSFGAFAFIRQKLTGKKKKQEILSQMKSEILNCNNYDEVVQMWRQKHKFLNTFPQLETNFKTLETTLFKYQFKQQRSENEKEAVMEAYRDFKNQSTGALNGI